MFSFAKIRFLFKNYCCPVNIFIIYYVKHLDGWTHLVIMLFGVLKHLDSLREVEIGMKAEVNKLHHLGMDYAIRRSTLADANKRRPQEFFVSVYAYLLEPYSFLADSSPKDEKKHGN